MQFNDKIAYISSLTKGKKWINRYTLLVFAFIVWVSVFDKYNLFTQIKLNQSINVLEAQKLEYEEQLEEAKIEQKLINSDKEKYGREKYLFHRENEEIILIK